MGPRRRFVLLCFASALFSCVVTTHGQGFCDDGRTDVDKDLGDEKDYHCSEGEHLKVVEGQHAGRLECTNASLLERAVCMDVDIVYHTTPPLGGTYRHIPPEYGEYSYLPPERWVHALGLGGLVFLYHPCAPSQHVTKLRDLARGCLPKHILTPYPKLTKEEPFAIVVWGCVFRMAQVETETAKAWIREQELSAVVPHPTAGHTYNHSLQVPATVVSGGLLCPDTRGVNTSAVAATPTESAASELPEASQTDKEHQDASVESTLPIPTVLVGHANKNKEPEEEIFSRRGILMSLFVVFCVLLLAGIVVAIILQRKFRWIKSSYKPRKYKFVGSFFPSKDTGTYIPPTGTPKVPGAEQSRLLDSDEEEV